MKNITRGTLATIAIASLLAVTACGSGSESTEQGAAPESAVSTPSVDANKAKGFAESFEDKGSVPADWKDGEALVARSAFVLGEYVAYVPSTQSVTGNSSDTTDVDTKSVFIIDDKGSVVYKSKAAPEGFSVTNLQLARVFVSGKPYVVFTHALETTPDPSSTRDPKKSIMVTVVNDQAKEVGSQVLDGYNQLEVLHDAAVLRSASDDSAKKVVDVATGTVSDLPVAPKDYDWSLRWDGSEIFMLAKPNDFSPAVGKLTNGTWTIETGTASGLSFTSTKTPTPFGSLMLVERNGSSYSTKAYDLVDPHTGKVVYGADLPEGTGFLSGVASADNKLVIAQDANKKGIGVFSITENKFYPIDEELNFEPTSVTNDGYLYGKSKGKIAGYNILKESEPKILADDVYDAPDTVSDSGIAIFSKGANENFVVIK